MIQARYACVRNVPFAAAYQVNLSVCLGESRPSPGEFGLPLSARNGPPSHENGRGNLRPQAADYDLFPNFYLRYGTVY